MNDALAFASEHASVAVDRLVEWLRIPSVSTVPEFRSDTRRAAEWLAAAFRRIGIETVDVHETGSRESPGHPIVYAEHRSPAPAAPTVLIYGHYDVQPPDPVEAWLSPPFEPVIEGGHVVARGASDDKGQLLMHVEAVEAYLMGEGSLPCHVKFVVEGEEESGSAHLGPWIEAHRDLLAADVALASDTAMLAPGVPSIAHGVRGLAYVEVAFVRAGGGQRLQTREAGGPNPVQALAGVIGGLHDERHRVAVDGFYDGVAPLSDREREAYAAIPFDETAWMEEAGIADTKVESGYSVLEAISGRPTLDCNGVWGGHTGEGVCTSLPLRATAKISCRLVPPQTPDDIVAKLRSHFERRVPESMTLEFRTYPGGYGGVVDPQAPAMQAAAAALERVFGRRPHFTREGGSLPILSLFDRLLGLDTVLLGFGLASDAIHSPNEKFGLDRFRQGVETSIRFMDGFARSHDTRGLG